MMRDRHDGAGDLSRRQQRPVHPSGLHSAVVFAGLYPMISRRQ
jgi:hypothetical protein